MGTQYKCVVGEAKKTKFSAFQNKSKMETPDFNIEAFLKFQTQGQLLGKKSINFEGKGQPAEKRIRKSKSKRKGKIKDSPVISEKLCGLYEKVDKQNVTKNSITQTKNPAKNQISKSESNMNGKLAEHLVISPMLREIFEKSFIQPAVKDIASLMKIPVNQHKRQKRKLIIDILNFKEKFFR